MRRRPLRPRIKKKASPVLQKVKGAAVKGIETYLKGTEALAQKIKPYADKMPKINSSRTGGRRSFRRSK